MHAAIRQNCNRTPATPKIFGVTYTECTLAEMVMLNEIVDASTDKGLLLDHDNDGEFHLISSTVAFMKKDLKRIAGFYEVVVPSYSIDEFRSHFRVTKHFKSTCTRIGSHRYNPYRKSFWKKIDSSAEADFGIYGVMATCKLASLCFSHVEGGLCANQYWRGDWNL